MLLLIAVKTESLAYLRNIVNCQLNLVSTSEHLVKNIIGIILVVIICIDFIAFLLCIAYFLCNCMCAFMFVFLLQCNKL